MRKSLKGIALLAAAVLLGAGCAGSGSGGVQTEPGAVDVGGGGGVTY